MCGANAMMVASAALQVGTAVLDYQNKKALAKQKTADNQVAMGHYNESYLNDLAKLTRDATSLPCKL